MNCAMERNTLLFFIVISVSILVVAGQQGFDSDEESSEDRFRKRPGRPNEDGGQFPRPNFPEQNQNGGKRPGRPNEDGGQFPQPNFPEQNQNGGQPGNPNTDGGQFPRPNFPIQNQNIGGQQPRPNGNSNIDGGQFPQPSFPDQNQNTGNQDINSTQLVVPNEPGVIFQTPCPCPAVGNFNPVCGTNNKTYSNPSVLRCHAQCGINVQFRKLGSCGSNRS